MSGKVPANNVGHVHIHLVNFRDDNFTAAAAHSQEETCKLVESGVNFVCDFNGNKIFRKSPCTPKLLASLVKV